MKAPITTVGELLTALAAYPPETRVRLAVAPGYPQAATIGAIACSPDDVDLSGRECDADGERVVWIGEGTQIGYLPATPSANTGPEPARRRRPPMRRDRPMTWSLASLDPVTGRQFAIVVIRRTSRGARSDRCLARRRVGPCSR